MQLPDSRPREKPLSDDELAKMLAARPWGARGRNVSVEPRYDVPVSMMSKRARDLYVQAMEALTK